MFLAAIAQQVIDITPAYGRQIRQGMFLVANRHMTGSIFGEAVILITRYDARGTVGLIINRRMKTDLSVLVPVPPGRKQRQLVNFGGPVSTGNVFTLLKIQRAHSENHRVTGDIFLAVGVNALRHIVAEAESRDIYRVYVGYSGWAPGQLESEIARGDWFVADSDPNIIFDSRPESIWQRLMKLWAGHWI